MVDTYIYIYIYLERERKQLKYKYKYPDIPCKYMHTYACPAEKG